MYKEKNNIFVGAIMYGFMFLFHIGLLIDNCKQSEKSLTDFLLISVFVISDFIAVYFLYKNKRQNGLGVSLWIIQIMLYLLVESFSVQKDSEESSYAFLGIIFILTIFFIIMFFKTQKTVFKVLPTIVMSILVVTICIGTIVGIIDEGTEFIKFILSEWDMYVLPVLFIITLIQINQSFEKDLNYVPGLTEFSNADNTDLLLEYEELLDMGAITPAEFEEKKKELLG